MKIRLLDCTLRDGGYINDWKFSDKHIFKILNALKLSNIDIVECGYLNDKKGMDSNSTLFKTLSKIDTIIEKLQYSKMQKVVMINFGDFDIKKLIPQSQTKIDGIRLAFHKEKLNDALKEAKCIIDLGYKLYFQPMITKNYSDLEFLLMIEKVNELNPYSFYIVDSFGSMTLDEFHKYLVIIDNNLNLPISIGYHSHNNMQLAFSNAVSMCSMNIKREIIIDASIYGIGRGAGNLNTELISDFLNKSYEKSYDTTPLLEIIDELLISLMQKKSWGFSPAQFLSAAYNCHPNYATHLINKNTNHMVGIKKILEKLPNNKKSSFDQKYIEKLYIDYVLKEKTPLRGKFNIPANKKVLLIASGKSVIEYKELISKKIKNDYLVIGLNHIPVIECDYYFFTNQKRYDEFENKLVTSKVLVTNNLEVAKDIPVILDFSKLVLLEDDTLVTNSTILAINYMISLGLNTLAIAGIDGYKTNHDNYSYDENSIITEAHVLSEQNEIIKLNLDKLSKLIHIEIVTPSIFRSENNEC